MKKYLHLFFVSLVSFIITVSVQYYPLLASTVPKPIPITINTFLASPPLHIFQASTSSIEAITPNQIKAAYHLPADGGTGTIAIVTAYTSNTLTSDINVFSAKYSLPPCTLANKCLEVHGISAPTSQPATWQLETSLDAEWAHAIAPRAKILVVEAGNATGNALLKAIDYARSRKGVVAISMSWGGPEFPTETKFDSHFGSSSKISFFAASGDSGFGAEWPAASPYVTAVGGTSLMMNGNQVISEKAWGGSGGGASLYEPEANYQKQYSINRTKNTRAIPDVSYNADPAHGFPVYKTTGAVGRWYIIGGTSAGTPQWAAIAALGKNVNNVTLYKDKAASNFSDYFRDITSGANGTCQYYCYARAHYDYVTGLGSPQTANF